MEDSSSYGKPSYVEIPEENILLELPNVIALANIESRIAVLSDSSTCVSVALSSVSEGNSTPCESRVHQLYMHQGTHYPDVPASQLAIVISKSFRHKCPNQFVHSSQALDISDELFNVLFGFELNLSNCPVMLARGPSGLVLWLAIKSVAAGKPSSVQVLCSLGDILVHVAACCFLNSNPALSQSYLILIGHYGHIVVISSKSGAVLPSYQHYNLLGPIHCCTLFDNSYLLYSSTSELYVADIGKCVKNHESGSIKSTQLGISGVTALSAVRSSEVNKGIALG